jgi:hypothetical protein
VGRDSDLGAGTGDMGVADPSSGTVGIDRDRTAQIGVPIITRAEIVACRATVCRVRPAIRGITPIVPALLQRCIFLLLQGVGHVIATVQSRGRPQ